MLAWVAGIHTAIGVIVGLGVSLFVPMFGAKTVTKPIYKNPSLIVFWILPLLLCGVWLLSQPRCIVKPGADLSECDLDLSEADLEFANLIGINLSGVDLSGAKLKCADLSGADLSGADLSGADLFDADLTGANLSGADLTGAGLQNADLTRADLSRSMLVDVEMYGAILVEANLSHADLTGTDLDEARIARATIKGIDPQMLADADHGGSFLSKEAQRRVLVVCDGRGISEAGAYSRDPGLHKLGMVVQLSGDLASWSGRLPARWFSSSLESAELVICVKRTTHVIETCEYELGSKVERVAAVDEIVLREARTGNPVARMMAEGEPPECPGWLTIDVGGRTYREYGDVKRHTVTNWLAQYVEPSE